MGYSYQTSSYYISSASDITPTSAAQDFGTITLRIAFGSPRLTRYGYSLDWTVDASGDDLSSVISKSIWLPERSGGIGGYTWDLPRTLNYSGDATTDASITGSVARQTFGFGVTTRIDGTIKSYRVNAYVDTQLSTEYTNHYVSYVKYNANGGAGAPSSTTQDTLTTTASHTVSSTVPTWANHTFLGWSTSASATTPSYYGGNSISVSYTNDVTLYAVWKLNAKVVTIFEGGYTKADGTVVTDTSETTVEALIGETTELPLPSTASALWDGSAWITSVTPTDGDALDVLARHPLSISTKSWTGSAGEYFTHEDMTRVEAAANALALELGHDRVSFLAVDRASQFRYDEAQKLEDLLETVGAGRFVKKDLGMSSWSVGQSVSYIDFNRWEKAIQTIYEAIGGDLERGADG